MVDRKKSGTTAGRPLDHCCRRKDFFRYMGGTRNFLSGGNKRKETIYSTILQVDGRNMIPCTTAVRQA
jgi:hypothetical protein